MEVSSENVDKIPMNDLIETIELTGEECRICLKKSHEMWQLFEDQHEIAEKLMACAAVQIIKNDGLPTIICCECRRLLDISYDFKCQVEKSDVKLREILEFKQSLSHTIIGDTINEEITLHSAENDDNEVKNHNQLIAEASINVTSEGTMIFEVSNDEFKSINANSSDENHSTTNLNENVFAEKLVALVDSQDDVIKEEESVMIEGSDLSDDETTEVYQDEVYPSTLSNELDKNDEEIKEEDEASMDDKSEALKSVREKCPHCIKTFSSKVALERHVNQHKTKTTLRYVCYMCDEQFSSIDKLKSHVAEVHDSSKDRVKATEDDRIDNKTDKNDKIDQEIQENQKPYKKAIKFACKYCSKQFTYEKAFLTHAKKHPEYVDESKVGADSSIEDSRANESDDDDLSRDGLQCTLCGKLFATTRNLKRHISTHSGLKFNCPTCSKEFSRLDKLKEHEQSKHKYFDDSDDENDTDDENKTLESENTKKEKVNNRPHKCPMCPKAFAQAQSLTNHMERHKRVKDTQKRFLCEVCSKCFAQSGSLVAHMRTHTGVKPYVCNVCSRAFTKSTYLQLHLRTHSGEKPYICQYCSRAFARANTLARHITMHTGEAKYHCQICMKSFRRLTSLNEHTYTHTGQRPYACKICTKRYNNAGSLYAHTKKCKAQQLSAGNAYTAGNHANHQNHQNNQAHHTDDTNVDGLHADVSAQMLGYPPRKLGDEAVSDVAVSATNSFMIANVQQQKPVVSNIIQTFTVEEANVYSKQFKNSYYTIYPSM